MIGPSVDVPALGQRWLGLAGVRIQLHERIHQGQDDVRRRRVRGLARVERRRLGTPGDPEHLLRGLSAGVGRPRVVGGTVVVVSTAPGCAERQDRDECRDEQEPSVSSHCCPPLVHQTAARRSCRAATWSLDAPVRSKLGRREDAALDDLAVAELGRAAADREELAVDVEGLQTVARDERPWARTSRHRSRRRRSGRCSPRQRGSRLRPRRHREAPSARAWPGLHATGSSPGSGSRRPG